MRRWDFLDKGGEYFFGAAAAPAAFHILYIDNECHAAFCRHPDTQDWLVLFNGLFYKSLIPGICKTTNLSGQLTIVEAKKEVERLCEHSS